MPTLSGQTLGRLMRYHREAPSGLGSSLNSWLVARSGFSRPVVAAFTRKLANVRPLAERMALVEDARRQREREVAEHQASLATIRRALSERARLR